MQDLPDVVWRLVVDQLRPSFEWDAYLQRGPFCSKSELAGIAALGSLCRVSSRHRALAEPALYRGLPATQPTARRRWRGSRAASGRWATTCPTSQRRFATPDPRTRSP
ncbi:hypothetical protein PG994_004415 [Apiospora phragmitis]|uniref:Uncharacterized protein n=1 Tax=Apiospora phragmitis TaxID=2905665 RepID=A0ABR1VQJ2_9PEZI